jgi:hypothetical protein
MYKSLPMELNENFYAVIAGMELFGSFFFRTRESMIYIPKCLMLITLSFYVNFTVYGFYYHALLVYALLILSICIGALAWFEAPAMQLPINDFNRPSKNKPRTMFQPFFSLTWYHDLPPIWSAFIPFYDRNYFN